MDYTLSPQHVVHPGTGFRMHDQNQPIPTQVTDKDLNSVLWSMMAVVSHAGLTGVQFDPQVPATYRTFLAALRTLFVEHDELSSAMLGGVGQSWQDVSGSRALGTTYTNTTGRPIALSLRTSPINSSFVNLTVGGVLIARRWGGETWAPEIPVFGIVPPGATYVVTGSNALQSWCELR